MGRKPTGRPRGRQKGSGTLGLGSEDAHQRLTIRIPQNLYNRLEAFAEGRHYTRGTAQLAGCVREAVEHFLTCPNKRQTVKSTSALEDTIRQTVNSTEVDEYNYGQTVNSRHKPEYNTGQTVKSAPGEKDNSRQTVNTPALVEDVEPVALAPERSTLTLPAGYYVGKLCPRKHEYQGTGQSVLTVKDRRCRLCDAEKKREKRAAQRQAAPVA